MENDKKSQLMQFVQDYNCPQDKTREGHVEGVINFFDNDKKWADKYPLHRAAFAGDVELIRKLVAEGHDPNQMMPEWFNAEPLGWSCSMGRLANTRELILLGADPMRPANQAGNTPLKDAQRERYQDVIDFLT